MLEYQYNKTNKKMRKILLGLFLFLILFSFAKDTVLAGCVRRPQQGCPATNPEQCSLTKCCSTPNECLSTPPPLYGTDPTCNGGEGIDTAIGCIPINDTNLFVGWILGWSLGIGGGIAFLLIIYASFTIMTSSGDPARLKVGKEILSSAVSGLIMLIFSVIILKFIGIDLLKLDQYGFGS